MTSTIHKQLKQTSDKSPGTWRSNVWLCLISTSVRFRLDWREKAFLPNKNLQLSTTSFSQLFDNFLNSITDFYPLLFFLPPRESRTTSGSNIFSNIVSPPLQWLLLVICDFFLKVELHCSEFCKSTREICIRIRTQLVHRSLLIVRIFIQPPFASIHS